MGPAVTPLTGDPLSVSRLCGPSRPRPAGAFSPLCLMWDSPELRNHIHLAAGRLAAGTGPSHPQGGAGLGLGLVQLARHPAPPGPLWHPRHLWGLYWARGWSSLPGEKPVSQNAEMGSWPGAEPRGLLLLPLLAPLCTVGLPSARC